MTEGYELSKDPAYQLSKDEKGCRIRVDGRGHYFATRDDKILYPTAMEITGQEIFCTVREADNSTTVIAGKNPEPEPLEGLAETEIQIYNHPEVREKIAESLFYTDEKGQKELTPLAAVLRDCVRDKMAKKNSKNPSLNEILNAVNELRDGTLEEQAVYGLFRSHLVENGLMPVDAEGRPYDLSVIFIPDFDPNKLLQCPDKQFQDSVLSYYQFNREDTEEVRVPDFMRCMNKMKTDTPGKFVKLYNYLAKEGIIPNSALPSDPGLTPEHIQFLSGLEAPAVAEAFNYLNNKISDLLAAKSGKALVFWNIQEQSSEWIKKYAPQINRTIANMRFGSPSEQKKYYEFCTAISGLQNMIITEEPTYPEEARSMFERAQAKQARATIETKL
ncbi:hypothetical protein GF343_04815 [Candidatus Woesearchaeota archaeon]|nr:hypothetical protein [Candidatus Woesearchaeota archaeon]